MADRGSDKTNKMQRPRGSRMSVIARDISCVRDYSRDASETRVSVLFVRVFLTTTSETLTCMGIFANLHFQSGASVEEREWHSLRASARKHECVKPEKWRGNEREWEERGRTERGYLNDERKPKPSEDRRRERSSLARRSIYSLAEETP